MLLGKLCVLEVIERRFVLWRRDLKRVVVFRLLLVLEVMIFLDLIMIIPIILIIRIRLPRIRILVLRIIL